MEEIPSSAKGVQGYECGGGKPVSIAPGSAESKDCLLGGRRLYQSNLFPECPGQYRPHWPNPQGREALFAA
jgi:hypothetical protein